MTPEQRELWAKYNWDEQALVKAADALERNGKFHRWWTSDKPHWNNPTDPIGRGEFLSIVCEIIFAYETNKSDPIESDVDLDDYSYD